MYYTTRRVSHGPTKAAPALTEAASIKSTWQSFYRTTTMLFVPSPPSPADALTGAITIDEKTK